MPRRFVLSPSLRALRAAPCGAVILAALLNHTAAADLPGWDRVRWGMTSAEIAAAYGTEAIRLAGRIEFYQLYTDIALRRAPFAGHDFTVYFQMDDKTHRLAQVMLERHRQFATGQVWRDVIATLEHQYGGPTTSCDHRGRPLEGEPGTLDRVWSLPNVTVRASYLAFGAALPQAAPGDDGGLNRRLLVRYAPPGQAAACPGMR